MKAKFVFILLFVLAMSSSSFTGTKGEVVEIKGRAVVIFEPTDEEYNSLSENEKNEWNEVLSDFYYYRDSTTSFLEAHDIKVIKTSNSEIVIHTESGTRTFIRKKFNNLVGYILTDGKNEPKVIESIGTDIDMIMDFKAYFNVK
jgi:hypothetical protein